MNSEKKGIRVENRNVNFKYEILERYECGIALKGTEVKSVKNSMCNLKDSFAIIKNNEVILKNMHISPYEMGNINNVDPLRDRKLLLNKSEILKISFKLKQGGLALVPTKLYSKSNLIKVEIALCKGKKLYDKREDMKKKDANKQIKIMSMFYGSLNLNNNSNRSAGRILTFQKFGEIKSVLYHDLVDYVNNERRFAEEGYFYILDKAAVYHLGLTNEYSHLVDGDIVNHMMDYSANELESIVSVMTDAQKESIANLFADKLYHGEELDLNKIAIISKHLPVGIEQMVQEKKDFDERAKAAKKDN